MKRLIPFVLAMFPALCAARGGQHDSSPIRTFDLSRYLGTWYEIARFDHSFERGMQNVTAEYLLRDDGKIDVINSGWKDGAVFSESIHIYNRCKMMNLHAIHIQPLKNRILWGFLIFLCIFAPGFDHGKAKNRQTI